MKSIFIFNDNEYHDYPLIEKQEIEGICIFTKGENILTYANDGSELVIEPHQKYKIDEKEIMVLNGKTIPFEKNSDNIILFGQYNCDVMIPKGKLVIDKDNLIFDDNVEVYVNGIKKYHKTTYAYGDLILLNSMLIVVYDKYLEITAARNSYQCFLPYYQKTTYEIERFPEYQRSPRVIK